jgi:hypothetical protein
LVRQHLRHHIHVALSPIQYIGRNGSNRLTLGVFYDADMAIAAALA